MRPDAADIFDKLRLPPELDAYLRQTNPWWEHKPGRVLPPYRRWAFDALLGKLRSGLAPVVVLRGARQVGKTTVQEQLVQHLLDHEQIEPRRIFRVQFEDLPSLRGLKEPLLSVTDWYQSRMALPLVGQGLTAICRPVIRRGLRRVAW